MGGRVAGHRRAGVAPSSETPRRHVDDERALDSGTSARPRLLTLVEVEDVIRYEVRRLGGVSAAAQAWNTSPQYVSGVLRGVMRPGPRILEKLGIRRSQVLFEVVR